MTCHGHQFSNFLLAEVIDLHEINTSHGPVPLKLRVSGVDCGLSGYHRLLNGNYTYQGKAQGLTGDRPRDFRIW